VVMYAANVLGSRGPRKMQVALPGTCWNIIQWYLIFNHECFLRFGRKWANNKVERRK
jgi:hypothetical protein